VETLERSFLIYNALGVNVVMTVQRRHWRVKEERVGVSGGAVRYRVFWMFIYASGLGVATRLQGAITGITPIGPRDCKMAATLASRTVNMLQVE
jgi:hypothetical protein